MYYVSGYFYFSAQVITQVHVHKACLDMTSSVVATIIARSDLL